MTYHFTGNKRSYKKSHWNYYQFSNKINACLYKHTSQTTGTSKKKIVGESHKVVIVHKSFKGEVAYSRYIATPDEEISTVLITLLRGADFLLMQNC